MNTVIPPTSDKWEPHKGLVLPKLDWKESPNKSSRRGTIPYLVVIHRPVGPYRPSINWLCNPQADASAHVITEGNGTGVDVATQLVAWDQKAWACASFNSQSYNIEADDDAWDGDDWGAFYTAAHICGFICHKTGIPPVWTHQPTHAAGITRHLDLGRAGGGHSDPTPNETLFKNFCRQARYDVEHTGWRSVWGKGVFKRIGK